MTEKGTARGGQETFLVTGGAGFIGSSLVKNLISRGHRVINVDAMTYAGNKGTLECCMGLGSHHFYENDINDKEAMSEIFQLWKPHCVFHLAAETHVDRSIVNADPFVSSNILGTKNLLDVSKDYWGTLSNKRKQQFRFVHVSTDEVYGSADNGESFDEYAAYNPSSPYSASKAASDHLVTAWFKTYGFPAMVTHCSNNYGPYQFPEKLIPLFIYKAINQQSLPVYGNGLQVRDWLHVGDHIEALIQISAFGHIGEVYNIAGHSEIKNIDLVYSLCDAVDRHFNKKGNTVSSRSLVHFVDDRPGHDYRYAINDDKLRKGLGWTPRKSFDESLEETVVWYLQNESWLEHLYEELL